MSVAPSTSTPARLVDNWLCSAQPKLPIQNPLWAFVHNNILLEFEHLPFAEAVREAAALYRANPYERETFYRSRSVLRAVLQERLQDVDTLAPTSMAACWWPR